MHAVPVALAVGATGITACTIFTDTSGYVGGEPVADAAADTRDESDGSSGVTPSIDGGDGGDDGGGASTDADAGSRYANVVLATAGLAGYWRLDEKTGTEVKPAHSLVKGTVTGDVQLGANGLVANDPSTAFSFTLGAVTFGSNFPFAGKKTFSIEVWHRPTALGNYQALVERHAQDVGGWILSVDDVDGYQFYREAANASAGVQTKLVPTIGATYHVVATYDGQLHRVYVNGVLKGTPNDNGTIELPANTTAFKIGTNVSGVLDEVALYDFALALPTIQAHYAAGSGM